MKIPAIALTLFLFSVPLFAPAVDGNWSGAVPGPNGDITLGFLFKADGEKLTGSMIGLDGNPLAIENGKVEGDNISFSVTINFNGNTFALGYKGVVAEDQIKMTGDFQGQSFDFVLKKVK